MKARRLELEGLILLELAVHRDTRGFFIESYHRDRFSQAGIRPEFVQDNHSFSNPGVIRGMHGQVGPSQSKLIRVVGGRIWDVLVDARPGSPTFGRHLGIELEAMDGRALWVPAGFLHGFCVLGSEPAHVVYKVDSYYSPGGEIGCNPMDPALGIHWPVTDPILSDKDRAFPPLRDSKLLARLSEAFGN